MGVDPDGGWSWATALIGATVVGGIGTVYGLSTDKENWGWYAAGGAVIGFSVGGILFDEAWVSHYGFVKNGRFTRSLKITPHLFSPISLNLPDISGIINALSKFNIHFTLGHWVTVSSLNLHHSGQQGNT